MNIKQLWGKDGYSVLTLYTVGTQDNVNVQDDFTKRVYDASGNVVNYTTLNSNPVFYSDDNESFIALKYSMYYKIHPQHELSLGDKFRQPIIGKD